ncbi:MAG: chemotaxis protein CheX [Thermotogaceae bacterium]|nr:chemotaxis protein CheX [Thermotogaceae bacterium]
MIEVLSEAVNDVFETFGVSLIYSSAQKVEPHVIEKRFCVVIGVVDKNGDGKGVLGFEFDESFITGLMGVMMPGINVDIESEMVISAISEIANMIAGKLLAKLKFAGMTTPPTGIIGQNMKGLLNTTYAYKMTYNWQNGEMAVSFSLA